MSLTDMFIAKAKKDIKKIVYPEGTDERILEAAVKVKSENIAAPVVLGNEEEINRLAGEKNITLNDIEIIDPAEAAQLKEYADMYASSRDIKTRVAEKMVKKRLSFGGMMVKAGAADGMVAGVASATANVIQSAALTIGYQKGLSTPSSFFIMVIPDFQGEKDQPLIFADCAVNIQPDARALAEIAVASGTNAKALLNLDPRIALLSFSTKGSASHADADKVIEALKLARELEPEWLIDGEMQGDAALISRVGRKKAPESKVAGQANVLIFPDLDAGNIAYKLVQYLGHARALGPVLQGFAAPVNDMSRGASVDDLVGVTAITAVQAQNF
ncbi:MAG TPA: phosphate acetyltransferase [Spirochaetota bacterium]|nr:phosphate acetyltransferase [Spirochaetota bacterium]